MNFNIIKTELRLNLKKYFWWNFVWILLFILLFSFFDPLKENAEDITKFVEAFGDFGTAFYGEVESFSTIKGYFNGEAFTFYLLVSAIFMGFVGGGVVGGEIQKKQLSFILSRQVSRLTIFNSKFLAQLSLLLVTAIIQSISSMVIVELFTSGEDHSFVFFLLSFLGSVVIQSVFLLVGILLGLLNTTGSMIAAGVAFTTWLLNLFSTFGDFSENLKYFTPFYYLDVDYIIDNTALDVRQLLPILLVAFILYLVSVFKFYKTDVRG